MGSRSRPQTASKSGNEHWITQPAFRELCAESLRRGWLSERDFLVAVAVGMISGGPVMITASFVGYPAAGLFSIPLLHPTWMMLK